jgi:hypothetical protein
MVGVGLGPRKKIVNIYSKALSLPPSTEWREDKECVGFFRPETEGHEKFSRGFQPINANLSKALAVECLCPGGTAR